LPGPGAYRGPPSRKNGTPCDSDPAIPPESQYHYCKTAPYPSVGSDSVPARDRNRHGHTLTQEWHSMWLRPCHSTRENGQPLPLDTPGRVLDTPSRVLNTHGRVLDTPGRVLDTPGRVLDTPGLDIEVGCHARMALHVTQTLPFHHREWSASAIPTESQHPFTQHGIAIDATLMVNCEWSNTLTLTHEEWHSMWLRPCRSKRESTPPYTRSANSMATVTADLTLRMAQPSITAVIERNVRLFRIETNMATMYFLPQMPGKTRT
jgi:hypothetical protein